MGSKKVDKQRPILASLIVRLTPERFYVPFQCPSVSKVLNEIVGKRATVSGSKWRVTEQSHPAIYGGVSNEIYLRGAKNFSYGGSDATTKAVRIEVIEALHTFVRENKIQPALYIPDKPLNTCKNIGDTGVYII